MLLEFLKVYLRRQQASETISWSMVSNSTHLQEHKGENDPVTATLSAAQVYSVVVQLRGYFLSSFFFIFVLDISPVLFLHVQISVGLLEVLDGGREIP